MRSPLMAALLVLAAGCAAPAEDDAEVLATFYPLAFAAERLLGGDLSSATIVPAGIEPHDWEPSAPDVARLADARLVLSQGGGIEPWLDGLVSSLGQQAPRIVVTTSTIDLAAHEHEEGEEEAGHAAEALDPHTWIAPQLFAQQVDVAGGAIAKEWPEHAAAVQARSQALQRDLRALHEDYEAGLATCEVRLIIANHDAYGYLAREHDFEVVALSGLSPEAEPDPQTIAEAIDVAREHNLTIIFFEELVSPRVAQIVAEEVQAEARVLSPIESAPAEGDYFTLMRANLLNLREAMRCT